MFNSSIMSILIHLDQRSHQNLFQPGGIIKVIQKNGLVNGFLFSWMPGETTFKIIDSYTKSIKTLDYFKCEEIWYTPKEIGVNFQKLIKDIENGKQIKKITDTDRKKIKELLNVIDSL